MPAGQPTYSLVHDIETSTSSSKLLNCRENSLVENCKKKTVKRKVGNSGKPVRRTRRRIVNHEDIRLRKETELAMMASLETHKNESHNRELQLKANSITPIERSRRQQNMYSLRDFKEQWKQVELDLGATTEEIENGSLVREANNDDRTGPKSKAKRVLSRNQSRAQYGRLLFRGMQQLMKKVHLTKKDIFLDIGHGIGNTAIQAAFMIGCEARGIEVVPERCRVAEQFREIMLENYHHQMSSSKRNRWTVGKIDLREGSLTDIEHEKFITEATVIFVNNANEIFGTRAGDVTAGESTLDAYVGALFAKSKPGTRMVTLHPLLCLGANLTEENQRRRKKGMKESFDASFFISEKFVLDGSVVNWTTKEMPMWMYTRVNQSTLDGSPLFMCGNSRCDWGNYPNSAVSVTGFLQEECVYCGSKRQKSTRHC